MPLENPNIEKNAGWIYDLITRYAVPVLGALAIFIIGWIIARLLQRLTLSALSRIHNFDQTVAHFLALIVRYTILIFVFIMVLGQFGVQTTSLLAILGGAALAIGMALQGTLQNIAAGIMLLVLRPFRIGEYITAGAVSGTVKEIGLFTTELVTGDGRYLSAPNSTLWNVAIINDSRRSSRRHDYTIRIGYKDDINKALSIMRKVIESQPDLISSSKPDLFVQELAGGSVVLAARYWIKNSSFATVSHNVTQQVKEAFDKNGITVS